MRIAVLGCGTWGFCLGHLLSSKGYTVKGWTRDKEECQSLKKTGCHPKLDVPSSKGEFSFTTDLSAALEDAELILESVTSAGIRPVFESVQKLGGVDCPIVISSKGIEHGTGLLLSEIVVELMGKQERIACLSGPSHAEEVIRGMPTSVVCSSYGAKTMQAVTGIFATDTFRVYPNPDMMGVSFGGAIKNVIAIACGISDGLGFGDNSKAALMTRGLHEMRKLSLAKGCMPETLNGLAGLGDLCVTCMSEHSRNYRFGKLIARGFSIDDAKDKIGMAVEGVYSCRSAWEMSQKHGIAAPISEVVYGILYEKLPPKAATKKLMERQIKEEHL